jgi:hypothetical protein
MKSGSHLPTDPADRDCKKIVMPEGAERPGGKPRKNHQGNPEEETRVA